jgi:hypothetical protein
MGCEITGIGMFDSLGTLGIEITSMKESMQNRRAWLRRLHIGIATMRRLDKIVGNRDKRKGIRLL